MGRIWSIIFEGFETGDILRENPNIAILQIHIEYRKIFSGLIFTWLLEVLMEYQNSIAVYDTGY